MSKHDKEKETTENLERSKNADNTAKNKNSKENENFSQLNIDSLSEADAKKLLAQLINENKQLNDGLSKIVSQVEELKNQAVGFKDSWYRTAAEFDNYKKRNDAVRKNAFDDGKAEAISAILVIGDSIGRALSVEMDEATKNGVELVKRQFDDTLKALGVEEIDPTGKSFNPETEEAIASVDAEDGEESGSIRSVFKKGYKLNGKMLRYAQVVVVK